MTRAEAEVVEEAKAEAGAKISSRGRGISCDTCRGGGCKKEAETKAGKSTDMFYSQ